MRWWGSIDPIFDLVHRKEVLLLFATQSQLYDLHGAMNNYTVTRFNWRVQDHSVVVIRRTLIAILVNWPRSFQFVGTTFWCNFCFNKSWTGDLWKVFITWIIMALYYNTSTANKTHLLLFMAWTCPELQHPISGGILVFVSITRTYLQGVMSDTPTWECGDKKRSLTIDRGSSQKMGITIRKSYIIKGNKMTRIFGHWSINEWMAWVMNGLV